MLFEVDVFSLTVYLLQDKREEANPNVIVVVFSTISTNVVSISEYKVEVSVPKVGALVLLFSLNNFDPFCSYYRNESRCFHNVI